MHVHSKEYGVAALGNIATHQADRPTGLATAATAALCKNLLKTAEHVALNVKADNHHAIDCHPKIGARVVARYEECVIDPS